MSDVKLLPCPFCGKEASPNGVIRRSKSPDLRWLDGTECLEAFYCNCIFCGVNNGGMAGGYQTREQAIEKWNTRPAPALTPKQKVADAMFDALYALTQGGSGHDRGEEWDRAEAILVKAGRL